MFHFVLVYKEPTDSLTFGQQVAFIILICPKFFYEMAILIIFIGLYRKFNSLSKDYQTEQKNNSDSKFVVCAKIICILVSFMYLMNTLMFDIVGPLVWGLRMHSKN